MGDLPSCTCNVFVIYKTNYRDFGSLPSQNKTKSNKREQSNKQVSHYQMQQLHIGLPVGPSKLTSKNGYKLQILGMKFHLFRRKYPEENSCMM